jgi:DNA-binding NarL/FixJ family response regulator
MQRQSAPTRVGLVDEDVSLREHFRRAIEADAGLRFAFAVASGHAALEALAGEHLDVLLVGLGLPDLPGADLIRACLTLQPTCAVMVLSSFDDDTHLVEALRAGARGYLLKSDLQQGLAHQVHALRAGGSPLSPAIARRLLAMWSAIDIDHPAPKATATPAPLTPKERDVLTFIARGYRYGEIAKQMGITIATVRTHARSLFAKLDVHNRTEAVFEARAQGVLR